MLILEAKTLKNTLKKPLYVFLEKIIKMTNMLSLSSYIIETGVSMRLKSR